jgi:hypothetical protein
MTFELYQQNVEKYSNVKFHENILLGAEFSMRKERHYEANSRFSQFSEWVSNQQKSKTKKEEARMKLI